MNTMVNPLTYMFNSFLLVAGTFGLWVYIYYALMSNPIKKAMQVVLLFVCILSAVDFALFGRNMGTMSNMLIYDSGISYSSKEALYNALAVLLVMVLVYLLFRRKNKILIPALVISIISMSVYSASNIFSIQREVKEALASIEESRSDLAQIELSKSGKNVVIIILDRAVGFYLPYIMNEKPELQKTYDGFTFYPNTISYGPSTNTGISSVYGGYEYTPEEMDKRSNEYLMDKHNEALRVVPVLFDENGYDVTVLDPCYAGYRDPEDLSIYDQYPDIKKWNTQSGMFDYDRSIVKNNLEELNRNLFCFGLTKAVPVFMQNILYNGGAYNSVSRYINMFEKDNLESMFTQAFVRPGFLDSFTVLQNMIRITSLTEKNENKMLFMYNYATHEQTLLQEPEYNVQMNVDNTEYEEKMNFSRQDGRGNTVSFSTYDQIAHYQINMATIQEIGRWLDYLKENDVYDNTRIIIVADHGANLRQYDDMIFTFSDGEEEDLIKYNPLLMYKDFDDEQFKIDERFMTNADTPSLALSGIIENPINPFTGNPIDSSKKQEGVQHLAVTNDHFVYIKRKTFPECDWISVHDDLFNIENWAECESFN